MLKLLLSTLNPSQGLLPVIFIKYFEPFSKRSERLRLFAVV
jgi:hypothetical protein